MKRPLRPRRLALLAILGLAGLVVLVVALVLLFGLFQARSLIRREFAAYFLSPIAYVVLVVFLAVLGCRYYLTLDQLTATGPRGAESPMQFLFNLLPAAGESFTGTAFVTTTITSSETGPASAKRRKRRRTGCFGAVKEATGPSAPAIDTATGFEGSADQVQVEGAPPEAETDRSPER